MPSPFVPVHLGSSSWARAAIVVDSRRCPNVEDSGISEASDNSSEECEPRVLQDVGMSIMLELPAWQQQPAACRKPFICLMPYGRRPLPTDIR